MPGPRSHPDDTAQVNLGIADGDVPHDAVNHALGEADLAVLFGEQTRLPHFPDDRRLPRLHAADPRVLFFWRVLKKVPPHLRRALIEGPISITLVRGEELLYFADVRCHQAVHIGRRRRTIYLPEVLLDQAEEKGYNHWAIAEGVIFAAWMLLDYLLLADVLTAFGERAGPPPAMGGNGDLSGATAAASGNGGPRGSGLRLAEPLLRRLVADHNGHRRPHPEPARSEVEEFVQGYRAGLIRVRGVNALSPEPWEVAREVFDADLETGWARAKMERIADLYDYPQMFLFDRDIIHGAARDLARRRGQSLAAAGFADALHDYRDALRFEPRPPLTELGRAIVPKPRAQFLTTIVDLGAAGLRGFFRAYGAGEPEALDLIHGLWSYLVSLTSDPAGVYARFGHCRSLCRPPGARIAGGARPRPAARPAVSLADGAATGAPQDGSPEVAAAGGDVGGSAVSGGGSAFSGGGQAHDLDRELAGILVRLDRRPGYRHEAEALLELGEAARAALLEVVTIQGLGDGDEWATFKIRKQAIVACACALLDRLDGGDGSGGEGESGLAERRRVHEDEAIRQALAAQPHRCTSDPSGVLMYVRSYGRTVAQFGTTDPDASFQLASILVRLDGHGDYETFLERIPALGPPAISALYGVIDQVSERDERRRPILQRARQVLGGILLDKQMRARTAQRARRLAAHPGLAAGDNVEPVASETAGGRAAAVAEGFIGLRRELLAGTGFLERGGAAAEES